MKASKHYSSVYQHPYLRNGDSVWCKQIFKKKNFFYFFSNLSKILVGGSEKLNSNKQWLMQVLLIFLLQDATTDYETPTENQVHTIKGKNAIPEAMFHVALQKDVHRFETIQNTCV